MSEIINYYFQMSKAIFMLYGMFMFFVWVSRKLGITDGKEEEKRKIL